MSNNAYILDLPQHIGKPSVINVEDLSPYFEPLDQDTIIPPSRELPQEDPKEIEAILDDQIILSRTGTDQRYLIHWKG